MGSHATSLYLSEDEGLGPLVRERIREKNIRQGLASVIGYLSTLSAWIGGDLASRETEISQVLHWLYEAGADYQDEKGCSLPLRSCGKNGCCTVRMMRWRRKTRRLYAFFYRLPVAIGRYRKSFLGSNKGMEISRAIQEFLELHELDNCTAETLRTYEQRLRYFST